jgi:hypothetical protein
MIYEIVCNITNEKYYGSTTTTETRRLDSHKCKSNTCTSKQIIDRGSYTFNVIERLDNPTKLELLIKEKEYITRNECINKLIPAQTEEELKNNIKNGKVIYYKKNEDRLKEYGKEWYFKNKEKTLGNVHKYYKKNRDLILLKNKEVIMCECGVNYTYGNKLRHQQSKKHINFIESK